MTTARNTIDQLKGSDPDRDWHWTLPYLRVSVPPDRALRMARDLPLCVAQAEIVPTFRDHTLSVDRVKERRAFLDTIQHDPRRPNNLLMVRGDKWVG